MDEFETYKSISQALGFSDYAPLLIQYGGVGSLESILKSNELWFGDLGGMNDGSECNHFIDAVYNSIEEVVPEEYILLARSLIDQHRDSLKNRSFASSWCEYTPECRAGDNLMWKSYADSAGPIAYIIDSTQFMPSHINAKRMEFFIFSNRVTYVQREHAADLLQQDLDKLRTLGFLEDKAQNGILTALLLLAKAPAIKHESFRGEKEIRFLFSPVLLELMGKQIPTFQYQQSPKSGISRTYMRFPLKEYGQFDLDFSMRRMLKQVLIGPSRNQLATEEAIRKILTRHQLNSVEVVRSDSPLRS
jgi:hypothetical protein